MKTNILSMLLLFVIYTLFTLILSGCDNNGQDAVSSNGREITSDAQESTEAESDSDKEEANADKDSGYQPPEGFDTKNEGVDYGTVTEVSYFSETTGKERYCNIYTPPGYNPDETYPVLYLLHSMSGIHTEWMGGSPDEILSNLYANGDAPQMITVMPNVRAAANDGPPEDMFGMGSLDAFDNFINDLSNDLMPFINENYPVSKKREETAIAGMSIGGRQALYIGVKMPETFGYVGAFSPFPGLLPYSAFSLPGQLSKSSELTLPAEFRNSTLFFICCGNQDFFVGSQAFDYASHFDNNGVKIIHYTIDGEHDFNVWKNGLYFFAKNIF